MALLLWLGGPRWAPFWLYRFVVWREKWWILSLGVSIWYYFLMTVEEAYCAFEPKPHQSRWLAWVSWFLGMKVILCMELWKSLCFQITFSILFYFPTVFFGWSIQNPYIVLQMWVVFPRLNYLMSLFYWRLQIKCWHLLAGRNTFFHWYKTYFLLE